MVPKVCDKTFVGKSLALPTWIFGTVCVCAQHPRIGMSPKYGPHGELFLLPFEERADGPQ